MTVKHALPPRRTPGRPRAFDIGAALDGAVQVFREHGYNAASLADLTTAMRLTNGSVYKAFRDKRAVFVAALDRYTARRNAEVRETLAAKSSGRDKVRAVLDSYLDLSVGDEGRRGCLVVAGATEVSTYDPDMADLVAAALQQVEGSLRELVQLGQTDGSIPSGIDADGVARALLCFLQGMRVIGKVGRSRAELAAAVDQIMRLL